MKRVAKNTLRKRAAHPAAVMAAGFLFIILAGTALLMMPFSSRFGRPTDFMDALFTATSASCVTGLVTVGTATHWSGFGQLVIILLIQIGGLGFMTMASLASFAMRRKFTLRERMVMSAGLSLSDNAGAVRITRRVLRGTFLFEGIGAALLSIRFVPRFGFLRGIKMGAFHSVSAFCNAGFDLMGTPEQPFASIMEFVDDPLVSLTIMALIVIGGVGFFVWSDLWDKRGFRRLRLHTKLALVTSGILLLAGFGFTLLFEWKNPDTLGGLSLEGKLLAAGFQSVTLRTAGFNTIDQAALTGPSQALGCILMLVGGSPGSTAGGIKTSTFAVLFLCALSTLRGKTTMSAFGRAISPRTIMNAVTMLFVGLGLSISGACAISYWEGLPFHRCLFETVSAFATVGVTMGITPLLHDASHILLVVLMYFGRVGVLTLGLAVFMRSHEPPKMQYPEGQVMVG